MKYQKISFVTWVISLKKYMLFIMALFINIFSCQYLFSQTFSRVLELTNPRMNGNDIIILQERLLSLGFTELGIADGYYGPNTVRVISIIQKFSGFNSVSTRSDVNEDNAQNGKVDRLLWDYIFNNRNTNLLIKIGEISKYNKQMMREVKVTSSTSFQYDEESMFFSDDGKLRIITAQYLGDGVFNKFSIYFIDERNYFVLFMGGVGLMATEPHYYYESFYFLELLPYAVKRINEGNITDLDNNNIMGVLRTINEILYKYVSK
jgi:hypothetical protein